MATLDWSRWLQDAQRNPLPFGGRSWAQLASGGGDASMRPLGALSDYRLYREGEEGVPDPSSAWYDTEREIQPDPRVVNTQNQQTNPLVAGGDAAAAAAAAAAQSTFGASYRDPGGGWNPWALYDGRQGYDGTNVDGWYDARRDSPKWELAGRGLEKDRDRVWRWTLDRARTEGWDAGDPANSARLKAAFLDNVARLRRDYLATPGLGATAWASSAFAGYDRMPGTQLPQGERPPAGAGTQPGTPTVPPTTPPTVPPTTPPTTSNPPAAGGGDVSAGDGPAVNPGGGGTASPTSDDAARYAIAMQDDRAFRIAQLYKALGLDRNARLGYVGSIIANRVPDLFDAWRQTQGMSDLENPQATDWGGLLSTFNTRFRQPGAIQGFQNDARSALGRLGGLQAGLSDKELMPLVQGFQQLMNFGVNDIVGQYRNNLTEQAIPDFLADPNAEPLLEGGIRFLPWLAQHPLFNFLTGNR